MALKKTIKILAIETSCDETAAAVLAMQDEKKWPYIETLSSVIKSQISIHKSFGGVVPEVAARAHVKNILPVVKKSLAKAKMALENINYIAVTAGPGLVPSLIVGVEFAKALSLAAGKPVIPVNHLEGHLYSPLAKISKKNPKSKIPNPKSVFPIISLIVSGGHTILTLMADKKNYKVLGQTVDDAAGEAFDKVAKLLKLPYPGGPEISKLAKRGKADINFPRPMLNNKNYNFSFAGLKTSVLYYLQDHPKAPKENVAASFQEAAVDVLVQKAVKAAREFKACSVSLSGGVSANELLRNKLRNQCKKNNLQFFVPPLGLCTDNAEMIGVAAAFKLHNGFKPHSYKQVKADPNLEL